jgi:chemotaxis protein CheD
MATEHRDKMIVVGLGEMAVSDHPNETLIAHALGSCLGVTLFDPVMKIGGMIHCMLPLSQIDGEKARAKPCAFVDTGLPRLIEEMFRRGCRKKDLIARAAGAGRSADQANHFRIGERNHAVFRKIMWKNGMFIHAEDIGGDQPRTLRLEIATGRVLVQSPGQEREL